MSISSDDSALDDDLDSFSSDDSFENERRVVAVLLLEHYMSGREARFYRSRVIWDEMESTSVSSIQTSSQVSRSHGH